MANFPIQYTEETPSGRGPNVPLNVNVSSGGEAIARGLANLGRSFEKMGQAKEIMDYSTYRRQFHEVTYKALNAHKQSNDPEKMKEIEEDWSRYADSFGNDNKEFSMYKNNILPSLGQAFANQTASFQAQTLDDEFNLNYEKLIEQNDYKGIEILVANAHKNGVKSVGNPALAEEHLRNAKQKIDSRIVFKQAIASEDGEKVIRDSNLPTDEKQRLMDDYIFEKQKSLNKLKAEREYKYKEFMSKIWNGELDSINEVRQAWLNGEIDETQKNNLEKTIGDPSGEKNDDIALAQMYAVMRSELNEQQKFDILMKLKPKLEENEVDNFIKKIYGTEGENLSRSHPIYKTYLDQINQLYNVEEYTDGSYKVPPENMEQWASDIKWMENAFERNGDNISKFHTEFERRIGTIKEQKARDWLKLTWTDILVPSKGLAKLAIRTIKGKTYPEPNTQAEYDALPKGTLYKHPDGTIKRK